MKKLKKIVALLMLVVISVGAKTQENDEQPAHG